MLFTQEQTKTQLGAEVMQIICVTVKSPINPSNCVTALTYIC